MIEIQRAKMRMWSMLGKRGTFGTVLTELAPDYDNLIAISADFARSSGLERYSKTFSDKFLNVGIAEQNLIGIASGLASEGYNVFATSFSSFITTRSYEQVKIHAGYMRHNIKVVGLKEIVHQCLVADGAFHKHMLDLAALRCLLHEPQAVFLQRRIVVVVHVVEADDGAALHFF